MGLLCAIMLLIFGVCIYEELFAADPPPRGISTVAEIVRWKDGDTAEVTLQIKCSVRLLECWAPEVRGVEKPQGLISTAHVRKLAPKGSKVRLYMPTTGRLQDSLTFGRVLGRMWIETKDGEWVDISEKMVEEGFATKEKVRR